MNFCRRAIVAALLFFGPPFFAFPFFAFPARAQAPASPEAPQQVPPAPSMPPGSPAQPQTVSPTAPPPPGRVVISSQGLPGSEPQDASPAAPQPDSQAGVQPGISSSQPPSAGEVPDVFPSTPVTNAERAAVRMVSIGLDLHVTPAEAREEGSATLVLRNVSAAPVSRVPLQLSSTLRWQSISLAEGGRIRKAAWTQSPIATDEDHTGYAQEALLSLPTPLAPGATLTLSALYGGTVQQSAERLELLGADPAQAALTDWDAIAPTTDAGATALRGFGNVLWYPVAAPAALLGEGNRVVELVAQQRHSNLDATLSLRLTVEYEGDPPDAVVLDGTLQPLAKAPDESDTLVDQTRGLATADFPSTSIGFRVPSLFLTAQQTVFAAGQALAVITPNGDAATPYGAAVEMLLPLMHDALGPAPLTPLLLLDHGGVPFEDGPFVAAQLAADASPEQIAPHLVRPLAHAFFAIGGAANLWLDQGVPELMSLLWTERSRGRPAVLAEVQRASVLIALAEPDFAQHPEAVGQPLSPTPEAAKEASAVSDTSGRLKASAVLWQLREILGDADFRAGLLSFRRSLGSSPELAHDPRAFQRALEHGSGKELGWFFDDWVYRDRGLPDLTIAAVNPRPLPAHLGKEGGSLVAVDVRNDGDAVAEVPVTVRAGAVSATERLRIPAHTLRSTRIVFEGKPETVEVNDGSVPELRASTHVLNLQAP